MAGSPPGVVNAIRQVGGVIGIALLGTLVAQRASFIPGLHVAVTSAVSVFLLGCALTLVAVERRRAGLGSHPTSP